MNIDYSTIWDTKTVPPIGNGITNTGTSTRTWSPDNFRVGGNRIIVEGGDVESIEADSLSDIIRIKVSPEIKFDYTKIGFSKLNKFRIKKIQVNPKKNATTVIFEDGDVIVVKKHEGDPDVDLLSVVAYAIAEKVYGSNSAFKRQIKGKVELLHTDVPLDLKDSIQKVIDACNKFNKEMRKR